MERLFPILILLVLTTLCIYGDALAGQKSYFKDRMKTVNKIALLPLDYEIISPAAMGSDKQREKSFSDERKNELINRFSEKADEHIKKRGYEFISLDYKSPSSSGIKAIVEIVKGKRKEILSELVWCV